MNVAVRWLIASLVYVVALGMPALVLPIVPEDGVALPDAPFVPWEMAAYVAMMVPAFIYLVHRPRVRGLGQLVVAVAFVWGTQTFMTQTETAYFRSAFPAISDEELVRLFLRNLLTLASFFPFAFWATGRFRSEPGIPAQQSPVAVRALSWKLLALGLAYVIVYFVFGYFIAYRFESVRIFYSESDALPSFAGQLVAAVADRPMIVPFQFVRGVLWAALAALLPAILRRGRWETTAAAAWLFAVLPTAQLVLANPFMPAAVRYAHLLEVGSSMALFGALAAWLLTANRPLGRRRGLEGAGVDMQRHLATKSQPGASRAWQLDAAQMPSPRKAARGVQTT